MRRLLILLVSLSLWVTAVFASEIRPGINLILLFDVSKPNQENLELQKRDCEQIISSSSSTDDCVLIVFGASAQPVGSPVRLDTFGKREIIRRIQSLQTSGISSKASRRAAVLEAAELRADIQGEESLVLIFTHTTVDTPDTLSKHIWPENLERFPCNLAGDLLVIQFLYEENRLQTIEAWNVPTYEDQASSIFLSGIKEPVDVYHKFIKMVIDRRRVEHEP